VVIARADAGAAREGLDVIFVRHWLDELVDLVPPR